MPKKIKDLSHEVTITKGFPGTYKWSGGESYYLDGNPSAGEVHFSIYGKDSDDFSKFHITRSINGSNVQVFFKTEGVFDGSNEDEYIKKNNLPIHKQTQWNDFWEKNKANFIAAAKDFWEKNLNP